MKRIILSVATLSLLASPAVAEEANQVTLPSVVSKFNVSLGGYVKLDYAHENNGVGPISPGAPGGGIAPPAAAGSKNNSVFTAKQSRIWMKVAGPDCFGAKTGALIEMDFYGAGSLSNEFANLRMRHAYGTLDWANTQVLFGQYWDIFGVAAADTVDFRLGGTTGNPANPRVPQVRLTHKINLGSGNGLKLVAGAQNPVQDSGIAGNNSMSKTGSFGDVVNFAGQVSFTSAALGVSPGYMGFGNNPLTFTLFGLAGRESFYGSNDVNVYGYGAYGFIPLIKSSDGKSRAMTLSLETQAYAAAGLDVQGATAMSVVGAKPDLTAAKGYGLYGQLKFYPTQNLGLTTGIGHREARDWDNVKTTSAPVLALSNAPNGPEKSNDLVYGNINYDLNSAIRVATELEHMKTTYDGKVGKNTTFRAAAYYFF